jgi:hypothetical protein
MNPKLAFVLVSVFFVALPACHSSASAPDLSYHVEDSMLANVPDGDRGDIEDARKATLSANDEWAAAKARVERAQQKLHLAQQDLDVAKSRSDRADAAIELAQNGTTEDLEKARQEKKDATALVNAAKTRIDLRQQQIQHAQAYLDYKQKQLALAQANAELAKARAVSKLDRPRAQSIDVAKFEKQVRDTQEAVDVAKVRTDAARKEVQVAQEHYDREVKAVPASYQKDWPEEEETPED